MTQKEKLLKSIPAVETVLNRPFIAPLIEKYSRKMVVWCVREALGGLRVEVRKAKKFDESLITDAAIENRVRKAIRQTAECGIKKVVNGTGIILSTNLGRAVLAKEAVEALSQLDGYSSLEVNLENGGRGERLCQVEKLLRIITGAEAAVVVNNNAAATMLLLNTFAKGKEVVVSRGQLIEIGGAFRLPDIMALSGCIMKEVGTTNRTHPRDYERAINENTGMLLHVHTSNYRIKGFTASVSVEELAALGKKRRIPVVDDLGSGALVNFSRYGFEDESMVQASLKAGADLVCFSSDKLISGPQGGIIIGKKKHIDLIRKNPLFRALRCGKLTLAALEATLRLFLDEETLPDRLPVLQMLRVSTDELRVRAEKLAQGIRQKCPGLSASVENEFSQMGGGSLSEENIPTMVVALRSQTMPAEKLGKLLRLNGTPVITRIRGGSVIIDMRTLRGGDDSLVVDAVQRVAG